MIAEVVVDISNSNVDRVFDYLCLDGIKAGMRVLVAFGKQTVEGYVTSLKEKTEYSGELKSIIKPLDEYQVISDEMLALMEYMVSRYHLRKADVLRLFIPSHMRGGRVKELNVSFASLSSEYINKDPAEFIRNGADAQNELFEFLRSAGSVETSYLNKNFSASALKNFKTRGIVEITQTEIMRKPYSSLAEKDKEVSLTDEQLNAVNQIDSALDGQVVLLHGVTGSGKTEVYMHCIERALKNGKSAVMLVPEISLTPQVLKVFRSRFGDKVALLHSGLSAGERFDEWRRLLYGSAKVAVGARSAVFAPLKNLGIIVIDEEHDSSYVSDTNPRYITDEVAEFRAKYNSCPLVLGSATPSIESYYMAETGKYKLVEMKQRVNSRALPEIKIVDMCKEVYDGNNGIFSRELLSELDECVSGGNQAIIFINRRGYSSYLMCRSCGYVAKCSECDVSLVYHKDENILKCHYCGNRYAVPSECPVCHAKDLKRGFVGTQQVAEQLKKRYPDREILRMDNDTTQNKDSHAQILGEFAQKKAAILVGTQMVAKGHDFPDVTLVGIVDADMSLYFADYRSTERTYQLITQVAGRAGRDKKSGKVVLQTYAPKHYVYKFAANGDYKGFYEKEKNLREVTKYPPFSKIVRILVMSDDEADAGIVLKNIFEALSVKVNKNRQDFAYFSYMKAPVKRIKNKYRVQILMRIVNDFDNIIKDIYNITDKFAKPKVSCFIEINPNNLS